MFQNRDFTDLELHATTLNSLAKLDLIEVIEGDAKEGRYTLTDKAYKLLGANDGHEIIARVYERLVKKYVQKRLYLTADRLNRKAIEHRVLAEKENK